MNQSENMACSARELKASAFTIYPKRNAPYELLSSSREQTIKEFIPASWFHPVGIFKVLARLWDRLPDVSGKLFLTLTLDPKNYANEETAFEDSRQWMRKVFFQLRNGVEHEGKVYTIDAPYCIKVEFHESGWVHYHAIFLCGNNIFTGMGKYKTGFCGY